MSLERQTVDRDTGLEFEHLSAIAAELNYLAPMAEKPFHYLYDPPLDTPSHNVQLAPHRVLIRNGRVCSSDLSLDREGFALATQASSVRDFFDEQQIRQVYYPEAAHLLQTVTGARQVIVFDHNLRNAERAERGVSGVKVPVNRVHNDFTAKSGYRRSRDELIKLGYNNPDALLQHRFSIINVWRPILYPVAESPIAVCAATSIASEDWVASDLIYRDRVGETYLATYHPAHQWFYFPQMQLHEVLLIKCFDSSETVAARFTAHTAFNDPTSTPDAKSRASIELRSLVIY